jgi:uncharacterized protein (TIGR00730 family)
VVRQASRSALPNAQAMRPYICVFCGASSGNNDAYAETARDAAERIVRAGFGIVYGGARIGLMGIVADTALALGADVIGVIPRALSHSEIAHSGVTRLHVTESMHERKALMAELSTAFVALPGGFGTMDEFCEILTWRQLGFHDKPVGLLNPGGYYDLLLALFDQMTAEGFVSQEARELFVDAPSMEALLDSLVVRS